MQDRKRILTAILAVFFCAAISIAAFATDYHWNVADGDWDVDTNWTPTGPLTPADNAYIDNGGRAWIDAGVGTLRAERFYLDSGTTDLISGKLSILSGHEYIGYDGTAVFNHFGGTHSAIFVSIGYSDSSSGIYNLIDGQFSTQETYVGYNGIGVFNQSGGTNTITRMYIGRSSDSTGTYNLSGGTLSVASDEYIGNAGIGIFNQTGGTHTISLTMDIGRYLGSTGTYNLSGGDVSAQREFVGNSEGGIGEFNQTGGTNTVGYLWIYENSSYTFRAGTLSIGSGLKIDGVLDCSGGDAKTISILGGTANFSENVVFSGGSTAFNSTHNSLTIFAAGFDPEAEFGSYNAQGLVYNAGDIVTISSGYDISENGWIDNFVHVQGSLTIDRLEGGFAISDGGTIVVREEIHIDNGQMGNIASSGGGFFGRGEHIGHAGTGVFNQEGGTHSVMGICLGYNAGSSGTYNLSAGDLTTDIVFVGREGTGVFNQTGGINTVDTHMFIGDEAGSNGTYNLSSGILEQLEPLMLMGSHGTYIGYKGTGVFNQTGGTHSIAALLCVGYFTGSSGTYNLIDGELSADGAKIGKHGGSGIFTQTGGTAHFGFLSIGTKGIYEITGGTLLVDENITVSTTGYFKNSGISGGGLIIIGGDFNNESELAEDFHLENTTLEMWGGREAEPNILDMNSLDYGANVAGLADNFAIGTLVFLGTSAETPVEGFFQLQSDIYCYGLVIDEGTSVDLNGYTLYYLPEGMEYRGIAAETFRLNGEWINGYVIAITDAPAIPEPGTIAMFAAGALGLAGVIRRRLK